MKSTAHNPFFFEGPVLHGNFIGRKREIMVLDRVSSNSRGASAYRGNGNGKTSLLALCHQSRRGAALELGPVAVDVYLPGLWHRAPILHYPLLADGAAQAGPLP